MERFDRWYLRWGIIFGVMSAVHFACAGAQVAKGHPGIAIGWILGGLFCALMVADTIREERRVAHLRDQIDAIERRIRGEP